MTAAREAGQVPAHVTTPTSGAAGGPPRTSHDHKHLRSCTPECDPLQPTQYTAPQARPCSRTRAAAPQAPRPQPTCGITISRARWSAYSGACIICSNPPPSLVACTQLVLKLRSRSHCMTAHTHASGWAHLPAWYRHCCLPESGAGFSPGLPRRCSDSSYSPNGVGAHRADVCCSSRCRRPPGHQPRRRTEQVALLFLVRDKIQTEPIWAAFIASAAELSPQFWVPPTAPSRPATLPRMHHEDIAGECTGQMKARPRKRFTGSPPFNPPV